MLQVEQIYATGPLTWPPSQPEPKKRESPRWVQAEGWLTSAARARRRRRGERA